jgi:hypothetical protein
MGANEMAKTPAGEKATDSQYKDRRYTVNDLEGVRKKEEKAIKHFQRRFRGER